MKIFKILFLLLNIGLSQNLLSIENNNKYLQGNWIKENSTIILLTGSIIVGSIILYKLCNNFFDESGEQLIIKSEKAFNSTSIYDLQIKILDEQFNIDSLSEMEKSKVVDIINEFVLIQITNIGIDISGYYLSNLKYSINNLKYYRDKLSKYINNSNEVNKNKIVQKINLIIPKLNQKIYRMEFLLFYVDNHASFFELNRCLKRLMYSFSNELSIINNFNGVILTRELNRCARSKFSERYIYPCLEYIENLENNINDIENLRSRLSYNYPVLLKETDKIISNLHMIKDSILTDQEYVTEKRSFENFNKK